MSKMVTLSDGRKAKVKRVHTLYGVQILQTKLGFVIEPTTTAFGFLYFEGKPHPSLWDAEEAIVGKIYERNSASSLCYSKETVCRTKSHELELRFFNGDYYRSLAKKVIRDHGGKAVACRLDRLGRIVDFLSVEEWYKKHFFKLPEGWHYFRW